MKQAEVRYYFDADIIGLGQIFCKLRSDCTYPGDLGGVVYKRQRPKCVVEKTEVPDADWIPQVTEQGLIIITRDNQIQRHVAEVQAVRKYKARMVVLPGKKAGNKWNQLEILMIQWREIEKLQKESGPFIYQASRSNLKKMPIC